jgi:hypothetical protein
MSKEQDQNLCDSNLTYYEVNQQLKSYERTLDPVELVDKIHAIGEELFKNCPDYLMLLCNDRRDYTIFHLHHKNKNAIKKFENDLKICLNNRGTTLTIEQVDPVSWEIWVREEDKTNFCYYLFDYSGAVLTY